MFLFLQEHWLPYSEVDTKLISDFPGYNFLSTASDMFIPAEELMLTSGTAWQGTTIGWSIDIDKFVTKLPVISDRFCGISYSDSRTFLLSYTAYLPTSGQDEEFLEVLAQLSADITQHRQNNVAVIIGADTNQSKKSSKRRTEAMDQFRREFFFKSILLSEEPTFHHNNQTSVSQIDTILYFIPQTSGIDLKFLEHLCKLDNSSNLSSHDVILASMKLPLIKEETSETDYSETYQPFHVKKPRWEESGIVNYQKQTFNVLSDLFEVFQGPEFIPALSEMCSKMLVISAEQNYEVSKPNLNKKKKQFPGFSKEHLKAYIEHEKICRQWRISGRPQSNLHPAKAAKLKSQRYLQQIARQDESNKSLKLHEELMETHSKDINNVCSKLKKIRGDKSKSIDIPSIQTLCGDYKGENVLEGFCANTEKLCNVNNGESELDHKFFKMCAEDNQIIFELTSEDEIKIPNMQLTQLKDIIFKRLKLNKACDIFKLTVEHLRNCGDKTLSLILQLLNAIIDHLNYLSSPQLNTAVATIVFKGKGKPVYNHKSYRQVRVTPLIGRLLDEYLRPVKISLTRQQQNINQYGFSEHITYMMGALQRHEVEKFCIDNKMTFFGCSLDGESAFEVVDRTIQLRELYCSGEEGEYWRSSKYSYDNSLTQIKMKSKLSRKFEETAGVKQGQLK